MAATNTGVLKVTMGQTTRDEEVVNLATIAAVSTADGSDPATTQALANQLKATLNLLLVEYAKLTA
jgi:hypothetical protein